MESEHCCPVCFGEENLKTLNGCGHEVCTDCEGRIKEQTLYGQNQVRTFNGVKIERINEHRTTHTITTQKFIKCPLCREFEKPTYSDLEDQIAFLTRYAGRPTNNAVMGRPNNAVMMNDYDRLREIAEQRRNHTPVLHPQAMRVPETVEQLRANIQNNNAEIAYLEAVRNQNQNQAFQNQNLQPHLNGVVPITDAHFNPPQAPVAILPPNPAGNHHAIMMARADENRNNRGLPPRRVWCINHNRLNANNELICMTVHGTQRRCNGRNCAGNINRAPCCQACGVCPNCR
jgi:hypothetical protein